MAGTNGVDRALVSVTYVDVDTPVIKVFGRTMGSFPVQATLLPAGVWVLPAVGEQWMVRRLNSTWYLESRVAFQDPKMNLRDKEGTTAVGSSGPTYVVGSEIYVGPDHLDLLEKIAELEQRIADLEAQ